MTQVNKVYLAISKNRWARGLDLDEAVSNLFSEGAKKTEKRMTYEITSTDGDFTAEEVRMEGNRFEEDSVFVDKYGYIVTPHNAERSEARYWVKGVEVQR